MNEELTIGEKYGPIWKITTVEQARAYLEECIAHTMSRNPQMTREEAERIERQNIGFYAGHGDIESARRVMVLFDVCHPFGVL